MRISSENRGWRFERTADGVLTVTPPTGALIDPYRNAIWTDGVAPAGFDLDFGQLLS